MKNFGNNQITKINQIDYYYPDSGVADAYAVILRPAITSYTAGLKISFKATNANTGASTINVNGLGTKAIKKNVSSDLAANDILAGQIIDIVYDGTNFQTINMSTTAGGGLIINNNADNRVLTANGSTTSIDAEQGLTYNGSVLDLLGDYKTSTGILKGGPIDKGAYIQLNNNNANGGYCDFIFGPWGMFRSCSTEIFSGAGIKDIFFQGIPPNTSGSVALEAWAATDLILSNANVSGAISFRVSRNVERMKLTSVHLLVASLATAGSAPATTGTLKMVVTDQNGVLSFDNIPSGGSGFTTADNGLTANTSTNVQLGGILLQNTTIDTSTYRLTIQGTNAIPLYVSGGTNQAAKFEGTSVGISSYGTSIPIWAINKETTNNIVKTGMTLVTSLPGAGANGLGISVNFDLTKVSGATQTVNKIISKLTDATTATSQFIFSGSNAGLLGDILTLNGNKSIKFNGYGTNTFTGTVAKLAGFTASGDVIEVDPSGLGGTVTSFAFTDGNGFDGTVTTATSTPTLSLTTTVTDKQVLFSNSGALAGDTNFWYDSSVDRLYLKFTTNQSSNTLQVDGGIHGHQSVITTLGGSAVASISEYNINGTTLTAGSGILASYSNMILTFAGNTNVSGSDYWCSNVSILQMTSNTSSTITCLGAGSKLRALAAASSQTAFNALAGGISTTVTHVATYRIQAPYQAPGSNWVSVTNFYGMLLEDQTQQLINPASITNRWAFYQEGENDKNAILGKTSIGHTNTPSSMLDIIGLNGYTQMRLRSTYTPSGSADGNGSTGDIAWDDSYWYVKTSVGWKRAALSVF